MLAAAAVPLAAGGMVVRNAVTGERTRQAIAEGTDIDPALLEDASLADYAIVPTGVLPEPVGAAASRGLYAEFGAFTATALSADHVEFSALLADPASLEPTRAACEADIPAVLIDLDPAGGLLALENGSMPVPGLVSTIEDLRRQGVAIAWITDREPTDAARIRQRLLETRLDPTGRDPLFVQRYPGELKQDRRQALLETHCLIAIAGDERSDFDELYSYLIDPTLAAGLEPMFGDGWFLIPTPLD